MPHSDSPVYGLSRPTIDETRAALAAVSGHGGTASWQQLLSASGLTGTETDVASLERLLATMTATGGVTAQCARAQTIRLVCHTRLSAVREMVSA
ncbi:hypothetical protein [Symbioplanes lichenis]|uniref:hypothetical protein n=1 Tax=Symbioplanes lichenis TaxID=1629072 RepID=UPI0027386ACF|nr:hypothetical protein [Actinoplanes lichenis]